MSSPKWVLVRSSLPKSKACLLNNLLLHRWKFPNYQLKRLNKEGLHNQLQFKKKRANYNYLWKNKKLSKTQKAVAKISFPNHLGAVPLRIKEASKITTFLHIKQVDMIRANNSHIINMANSKLIIKISNNNTHSNSRHLLVQVAWISNFIRILLTAQLLQVINIILVPLQA